jgi:hypothetical protein
MLGFIQSQNASAEGSLSENDFNASTQNVSGASE